MAEIQYLGYACFRVRGREGIVLCDPFERTSERDMGRPTAHIVTLSQPDPRHNYAAGVRPMREQEHPFVIDGPGEYEVREILITGVRTIRNHEQGAAGGFNTIYTMQLDEITFCHLGGQAHELTQQQLEDIGNIDVLLLPVGGGTVLKPADAASVMGQIEPRVVIPMLYADSNQLSLDLGSSETAGITLDVFAREVGLENYTPQERVILNRDSLPQEGQQARIIVMQPEAVK